MFLWYMTIDVLFLLFNAGSYGILFCLTSRSCSAWWYRTKPSWSAKISTSRISRATSTTCWSVSWRPSHAFCTGRPCTTDNGTSHRLDGVDWKVCDDFVKTLLVYTACTVLPIAPPTSDVAALRDCGRWTDCFCITETVLTYNYCTHHR